MSTYRSPRETTGQERGSGVACELLRDDGPGIAVANSSSIVTYMAIIDKCTLIAACVHSHGLGIGLIGHATAQALIA